MKPVCIWINHPLNQKEPAWIRGSKEKHQAFLEKLNDVTLICDRVTQENLERHPEQSEGSSHNIKVVTGSFALLRMTDFVKQARTFVESKNQEMFDILCHTHMNPAACSDLLRMFIPLVFQSDDDWYYYIDQDCLCDVGLEVFDDLTKPQDKNWCMFHPKCANNRLAFYLPEAQKSEYAKKLNDEYFSAIQKNKPSLLNWATFYKTLLSPSITQKELKELQIPDQYSLFNTTGPGQENKFFWNENHRKDGLLSDHPLADRGDLAWMSSIDFLGALTKEERVRQIKNSHMAECCEGMLSALCKSQTRLAGKLNHYEVIKRHAWDIFEGYKAQIINRIKAIEVADLKTFFGLHKMLGSYQGNDGLPVYGYSALFYKVSQDVNLLDCFDLPVISVNRETLTIFVPLEKTQWQFLNLDRFKELNLPEFYSWQNISLDFLRAFPNLVTVNLVIDEQRMSSQDVQVAFDVFPHIQNVYLDSQERLPSQKTESFISKIGALK